MYELLNLLDTILGQHQKFANNEYYWNCPFCHHYRPKLAINLSKEAWHCWVCGASGRKLFSLFKKLDCSKEQTSKLYELLHLDYHNIDVIDDNPIVNISLPPEYEPLWKPSKKIDYKNALRYILSRKISLEDILKYQIGYCSEGLYKDRIIIPSFDDTGKLNYFVGRKFYEDCNAMKYKNPPISKNIIMFDYDINWEYDVILCEGVFDAISIKRNAIPLLGKTIPLKLYEKIISTKVKNIYLALDNDAISSSLSIAEKFIKNDINVYMVNLDDKDPSEIGFEHMIELINKSSKINFYDLIKMRVNI